ncbi:hypothetical protein BDZ89DRAFT_973847 [Hymenopellis radicata]|nr:hypothetical protein BDZ89DRAFT_973847 [Hymenopellis radicata]
MERIAAQRKIEAKREAGRERQQIFRDNRSAEKRAAGWTPNRGNHKRRVGASIATTDGGTPDLAEASRPRRQFKEDLPKKSTGQKRLNPQEKATRTNWFLPTLFSQIEQSRRRVGWSPRDILRDLKSRNQDFNSLTEQVIGRWKVRGEKRWRDTVLEAVKKGNRPGGKNTRTGILVSPIGSSIDRF